MFKVCKSGVFLKFYPLVVYASKENLNLKKQIKFKQNRYCLIRIFKIIFIKKEILYLLDSDSVSLVVVPGSFPGGLGERLSS